MKRDEIRKLIPEITDEQLNALMDMNGSDVNAAKSPISDLQRQLDEANDKIGQFTKQQQAQMTQEEQLQALQKSLEATQRDLTLKTNRIDAKAILKAIGLDDDSVEAQLDLLVTEDQAKTVANATMVANLIKSQREATEAATKKAMLKQTPTPAGGGSGDQAMTKDAFDKMSYAEKADFMGKNPEFKLSSLKN